MSVIFVLFIQMQRGVRGCVRRGWRAFFIASNQLLTMQADDQSLFGIRCMSAFMVSFCLPACLSVSQHLVPSGSLQAGDFPAGVCANRLAAVTQSAWCGPLDCERRSEQLAAYTMGSVVCNDYVGRRPPPCWSAYAKAATAVHFLASYRIALQSLHKTCGLV